MTKGIIMSFQKTFTKSRLPKDARVFQNGDMCMMKPYVAKSKEPLFGYYRATKTGWKFDRSFWRGKQASRYNWCLVNPDKVKAKPAKKKKPAKKTYRTEVMPSFPVKAETPSSPPPPPPPSTAVVPGTVVRPHLRLV